jgi:hypothetical protein
MPSHLKTSGPRDGAKPQLHDVDAETVSADSRSALVRLARALGRLAARYRFGSANTDTTTTPRSDEDV